MYRITNILTSEDIIIGSTTIGPGKSVHVPELTDQIRDHMKAGAVMVKEVNGVEAEPSTTIIELGGYYAFTAIEVELPQYASVKFIGIENWYDLPISFTLNGVAPAQPYNTDPGATADTIVATRLESGKIHIETATASGTLSAEIFDPNEVPET